jgi:hypothetical protein
MKPLRHVAICGVALLIVAVSGTATLALAAISSEDGPARATSATIAPSPEPRSSSSRSATQGARMTSVVPPRSEAAVHATQLLVDFLTHLTSTTELTPEHVGKQFGGALIPEDGALVYRSADLGGGWNYGVKVILPKKSFKAGFSFWLYNPNRDADPTPVCVLSLDALRKQLVAHGFIEQLSPSEIGGIDWVDFVKNDIVLTVTRRDLMVAPNGDECFSGLQTTDGL